MIEILTHNEVAELLRISPNRVLVLARRGEIPSVMIDGRVRFHAEEIEDWIKARRGDALGRNPPKLVGDD